MEQLGALYQGQFHIGRVVTDTDLRADDRGVLVFIPKRDRVRFCIQQIPFGRCRFHDFVFAKIQRLADGASIAARGDGVGDLSGAELQRAVRSFDIGLGADLKHRAFERDIGIGRSFDRSVLAFGFGHAGECRADLLNRNFPHDRRIGALHHDGLAVFANAKGDGGCVEQISDSRLHLMQGVIAIQQRLGQHQCPVSGRFKHGYIHRGRIELTLYDPVAVRILNPKLHAGSGDDFAGFRVQLSDFDLTLEGLILQSISKYLFVNVNGHIEGLHQFMTVDALDLCDGVCAVQERIGHGITRRIGGQRIHDLAIRLACDCEFDARKGSCLLVAAISEIGVLDDDDPAAYDGVLYRDCFLNDLDCLPGVFYDHRILVFIEGIAKRRRFFPHHITAKGQIRARHHIRIRRQGVQHIAFSIEYLEYSAVERSFTLRLGSGFSIQLGDGNGSGLGLVRYGDGFIYHLDGLTRIGQLHIVGSGVQHEPLGRGLFLYDVCAKGQQLADRLAVGVGGERIHNSIAAVDLKHRAGERIIAHVRIRVGLLHGDLACLRLIRDVHIAIYHGGGLAAV